MEAVYYEHGGHFKQNISATKIRYQGKWTFNMIGDYYLSHNREDSDCIYKKAPTVKTFTAT